MQLERQIPTAPPPPVPLREAIKYWLKLGFISFGGPAGQISIMHQELVERRRWISERRFFHALNYCMVLPGPEAQQLAAYIGWLMHGMIGGVIAGTLFFMPSLLMLIALSWVYMEFGQVSLIAGVLYGFKPAVTAIVLFAAYRIGSRTLTNGVLGAVASGAFLAIFVLNIPFPYIVLGAGLLGLLGGRLAPEKFTAMSDHADHQAGGAASVLDDTLSPPEHVRFRWSRLVAVALVGLVLWGSVIGLLAASFGLDATLTRMGWFFTKAAFVTFGGAYAVLPYVYQAGVFEYQWLTGTQMIDGLALGETTPGPLIMVVTFVGFVGGWTKEVLGPDQQLLAGTLAACVVTFFTFLPSFLFILVGGPLVESTHGKVSFTAPLTGITAAVVGVIFNLALFFAYHVLWPQGFDGSFEWPAGILGMCAGVALFRYKAGIIPVILASGVGGAIYYVVTSLFFK